MIKTFVKLGEFKIAAVSESLRLYSEYSRWLLTRDILRKRSQTSPVSQEVLTEWNKGWIFYP